jgi:hypothetical protein
MMRYLSVCVVAAVVAMPASAHFGFFRQHAVTRVAYYYVPLPYYVPVPAVVYPPPVIEAGPPMPPVVHPLPTQPFAPPPAPATHQAAPQPAPASPAEQLPPLPAPPIMQPPQPEKTTALKVEDPYFKVYTNAGADRSGRGDRKSVTFWNLTDATLTLTVDGQKQVVPAKSSQTMQVAGEFAWRVEGREPEAGSMPSNESGVTIVIRR